MQIRTKSRVAIAAILDVATNGARKPVSLADISKRQHISLSYLEVVFKKLREKGFVVSFRGPGGGYQMCQSLASISVADIIGAVDAETFDGDSHNSVMGRMDIRNNLVAELWGRVNDRLYSYLSSVTLESILANDMLMEDFTQAPVVDAAPLPSKEMGVLCRRSRSVMAST